MRTALLVGVLSLAGCSHDSPSSKPTVVSQSKMTDWILVKHGTPELIRAAVLSHADVTVPEKPQAFTARVTPLSSGGHAVEFNDKAPPYAFANLISWLNDPPDIEDVSDAIGWYTSPSTEIRYFLRPDDDNPSGDTLVGASKDSESISVYLPELAVCRRSSQVGYVSDTDLVQQNAAPVLSFDVVLDVDESFGNPKFELTHEIDARW